MKVILRPLLKDAWAGVIKYKNCYEDIKTYFTRSGALYTGLIEDEAKRLGDKLGLDLSRGSEFWRDFYIRTYGKDVILDLDDPMDELRYLFLKNHRRVKEGLTTHKASANFVLINEEEESKKSNLHGRYKRDAIRAFDKLTVDEMRRALRLFGRSAEELSPEVVENRLFEIVEGDPEGFLNKWVNNPHKDIQYLIERAISLGVIRKNKRIYTYGTDTIGNGIEEVIAFLKDPMNQEVKEAIKLGVEGKKYIDKPPMPKVEEAKLNEQPKQQLSMKSVAEVKEELSKKSTKK